MKVLFIGGTGNISSACVERALALGMDVSIVNRGQRPAEFSGAVTAIVADRNDLSALRQVAERERYDVVANFVGYTPDQIETDLTAFAGRVGQYIYISSASVYQKPPNYYRVTESTPLCNPYWEYSRNKITCEERLNRAYREQDFPVTIVRPSYTFGPTWIPNAVSGHGYTVVDRMRRGLPVVSHGDGQSLWTITFHTDFALAFVGLFGKQQALGEAFHITSDEVLTWDQILQTTAHAAGAEAKIVHVSSEWIAALYPATGAGLLGDKAYSLVFDNAKVKRVVPEFQARVSFAEGIARAIAWHDADPARRVINAEANRIMERLVALAQGAC